MLFSALNLIFLNVTMLNCTKKIFTQISLATGGSLLVLVLAWPLALVALTFSMALGVLDHNTHGGSGAQLNAHFSPHLWLGWSLLDVQRLRWTSSCVVGCANTSVASGAHSRSLAHTRKPILAI